jgi:hypothetical protein
MVADRFVQPRVMGPGLTKENIESLVAQWGAAGSRHVRE